MSKLLKKASHHRDRAARFHRHARSTTNQEARVMYLRLVDEELAIAAVLEAAARGDGHDQPDGEARPGLETPPGDEPPDGDGVENR